MHWSDNRRINAWLEQFHQGGVFQPVVGLGQHILEVRVLALDGPHGVVDGLADVLPLGQVEHAHGLIPLLVAGASSASTALPPDLLLRLRELHIRVPQEDQSQHGDAVF